MKKYILTTFALISTGFYAQKIKKDSVSTKNIDEVVVTSSRMQIKKIESPLAISKLSEKQINETKATAVFELVNKTPGVMMANLGNEQHSMAIRQPMTTNAYFLYLEDGLPIRPLGVFNHNALLEINQFNLQNIEVVKGPVSSLYGPEAVGGAINLISKKPSLKNEMKVGFQGDQFHYNRFQAMGSGTLGKFGFHISGLTSIQKNSWMTYSDYEKYNINGRFDYTFNKMHKLIATVFYGDYYSQMSGSVNEYSFYHRTYKSLTDFAYRKSEGLRSKLTYELNWNANAQTQFTAFLRKNNLGQNPSYSIKKTNDKFLFTGEVNSNSFKSYGLLLQHIQKINFMNTNVVAGGLFDRSPIDYWAYRIDLKGIYDFDGKVIDRYELITERPDVRLKEYNGSIFNYAGFVQFKTTPFKKMVLTAGGRYDKMKIDYFNAISMKEGDKQYDQFTFKLGLNYNPFSFAGLYANYAQGFAPPGASVIFETKAGTGKNGVPAEFNYDLKSAIFNNYEVGGWFKLLSQNLVIDYSVYYMQGKNELINTRLVDNSTDYRSVGETLHKGVELGLNYKPFSQLNLRVGGAYSEHKFIEFVLPTNSLDGVKDLNGKEMPSAPRWVANTELSYYPKWLPNFRIATEMQYVSSFYQDQINTVKYDGYQVFNGRVAYKIKGVEAYLNVMNFTDKLYAYNVTKGNVATQQPTYTPSAPRTFVFGLQYDLSL
ncbi:TonB-dependent receptor [Flavobacterium sp.]|uniref:TonB-dependent receptor n=1 Tax=Flavobacterium sp. TaxID=239 RepID=UPI003D0D31F1